jgi:hypothetical protein
MDFIIESKEKLEKWCERNKKEIVKIMDAQYKILFENYFISITLTNITIGDKIIHFVLDWFHPSWNNHKELESIEEVIIVLNSEIEKEKEIK